MTKRFAVFDIDGTVFRWQLYHELVFELIEREIISAEGGKEIKQAFNRWRELEHAWQDYELTVVRVFEQHLPSIAVADFIQAAERVVKHSGKRLYKYTHGLIHELKNDGYTLIALSNSFTEVLELFALQHGFDIWDGRQHKYKDGYFLPTGRTGPTTPPNKGDRLKKLVARHGLAWEESVGVGDTRSDIAVLELVAQPIAFNPSRELLEHAQKQGWKTVIERKDVAYELNPRTKRYTIT